MRKLSKKWKLWGLFLILMFFAAGATVHTTVTDVQAATKNGFKTEGGKSYYYKNGKKVKGWLTLNRKKYYFNASTGVQVKGWAKDSKGKRYFYNANGAKGYMATGWLTDSKKNTRYFNPSTGYMTTKWATISNKKYYFYSGNGVAAKSTFLTDSKNVTRYFTSKCFMATAGQQHRQRRNAILTRAQVLCIQASGRLEAIHIISINQRSPKALWPPDGCPILPAE